MGGAVRWTAQSHADRPGVLTHSVSLLGFLLGGLLPLVVLRALEPPQLWALLLAHGLLLLLGQAQLLGHELLVRLLAAQLPKELIRGVGAALVFFPALVALEYAVRGADVLAKAVLTPGGAVAAHTLAVVVGALASALLVRRSSYT